MNVDTEEFMYLRGQVNGQQVQLAELRRLLREALVLVGTALAADPAHDQGWQSAARVIAGTGNGRGRHVRPRLAAVRQDD